MKKQECKQLGKEEGFFSAFVLIFLVTLGLMGMGASILVQSDSKSIIRHMNSRKSDYVIEGAAFYAAAAVTAGKLTSDTTFTINNIDVSVVMSTNQDCTLVVNITADIDDDQIRTIQFEMEEDAIWKKAIYMHGDVDNSVVTRDSTGAYDWDSDLIVANKSMMPPVTNILLFDMASDQDHDRGDGWTPTSEYPYAGASFYESGITPNVTYVMGDMTVNNGITVWGIFVVDGDVELKRNSLVNGIIYLVNSGTQVIGEDTAQDRNDPNVEGGIFGLGEIDVLGNKRLYVKHNPEWMRVFDLFVNDTTGTKIAHWSY
jgi:hypothetical protein